MKKSTLVLLGIGTVCIVAVGLYARENTSSTTPDNALFSTQSVRTECINNEEEYISCRKEGMSEKFCLIKQSKNLETGKSCLSKIPDYSKPVTFTTPVENEDKIYTDRVTIMLSEKNTGNKTIVTDYNNTEQSAEEYTANGLRQETTPYEKELMDYLNIALRAYDIVLMDNWSSSFASRDPKNVNANFVDIVFANETDMGTFVAELQSKIDKTIGIFPVFKKELLRAPNDPQANNLWYLKGGNGVHAYNARNVMDGSQLTQVPVGIVDDGFYVSHEDLNFSSAIPAGAGGGHGTHIAGLIGALTDNEIGIASAARNAGNILQIKGYNYNFGQGDNDGYLGNIISLVEQAVEDGAKVINMSWGIPCGYGYNPGEAQIFQSLYNQGVVLIAAAGNSRHPSFGCPGVTQPDYPARYAGVISVGNTTEQGSLASSSNPGADILSPGTNINSTCIGGGYCKHSGTSMSSALATSVASLLLTINPSLSPDEIENILKSTTNPKGVINACNAVAKLLGKDATIVCADDENTGGTIGENCLGDSECLSGVCEEIIEGKCISGQYGEKPECKGFTTEEQCLGFKQNVGNNTGGSTIGGTSTAGGDSQGGRTTAGDGDGDGDGDLVSVCVWKETVVGGTCVASCGNKIIEGTEQCDDGNTKNGDGCSATCEKEETLCEQMKNNKAAFDYNNDGLLNQNDVKILQDVILGLLPLSPTLDGKTGDLNKDNKLTAADITLYKKQLQDCFGGVCGNAIKEGTEQCDDGNDVSLDGCSNICEIEQEAYCEIIANPNPAVEGQGVQFVTEGYAPWADSYNFTITDGSMGRGIPFESFGGFPIGIGHFAGKGPITINVNLTDKDTGENITCTLTIPVKKAEPVCGNNIIEDGEQCDGSGCAKGQICAPAGSKAPCTCQFEIIKEPAPTPPTREEVPTDR